MLADRQKIFDRESQGEDWEERKYEKVAEEMNV
jgi:hypothetical protein